MKKHDRMIEQIIRHGETLKAVFHLAPETDALTLCKKLRRLELTASRMTLALCNGDDYMDEDGYNRLDRDLDGVLAKVDKLLGYKEQNVPVFVNRDPRGYALKIQDEWMKAHEIGMDSDWGGYGLIAPEFTGD